MKAVMLNVTDADIDNAEAVAKAVAIKENLVHKATFTPSHPIDYTLSRPVEDGGGAVRYLEIKCRSIKYDPFKISKKKLTTAFNIAKRRGVPLQLWIWFRTDGPYASGMGVVDLKFPVGHVRHGNRRGNGEQCFDIPISKFNLRALVTEDFKTSLNSFR